MTDMYSIGNHDDTGTPITMERTKMKYHPELWTPAQILLDNFQEELSKCIEIGKSTCHSQTFRRMQNHQNSDVS